MNQTIRKRIEDIINGIVPEGYKQTIVGVCPLEWEEHTLADFLQFKNGLNKEKSAFGSGTPIVNYTDVWKKRGLREKDIIGRVQLSQNEINNYEAREGDVFFTRTSETIDEIGFSSVLLESVDNAVFSGFVLRGRPYNDMVVKEYHQYCYSSDLMRSEIKKRSSMTTRALTSGPMLSEVAINLPSKPEQSKIAEILMKWDEMVELQEQYIQKIELRKKAIMKKLLTPKDGWKKCKLKDFIKVKSGYAFKSETYVEDGKYQILTIKNVQCGLLDLNEISTISELPPNIQKHQILALGDIIISLTGNVGRSCYITKENCLLNQRVGKVECSNVYKQFVYAVLQTDNFINAMINIAQGGAQANLSNEDVENFEIFVPFANGNIDEKTIYMIGQINLTIDKEISLQKEKLEKIKIQCKAMQQYLLTGIVRVR